MADTTIWLVIIGIGLGTYALRLSFIHLHGRFALPAVIQRGLRLVPAAVLAALVAPALVHSDSGIAVTAEDPRLLAGLVALLVAWRFKHMLLTLASGMAVLWLVPLIG